MDEHADVQTHAIITLPNIHTDLYYEIETLNRVFSAFRSRDFILNFKIVVMFKELVFGVSLIFFTTKDDALIIRKPNANRSQNI